MSEVVATPVLEELPTIGGAGDGEFDVFSSLRGGAGGEDLSAGIDSVVGTAGADGAANGFDLVAVANGEKKLDATINDGDRSKETSIPVDPAMCRNFGTAACIGCIFAQDCQERQAALMVANTEDPPEQQLSTLELLLREDDEPGEIVWARLPNAMDSEVLSDPGRQTDNEKYQVDDAKNTTSEPEPSFKDDLADDGNKESSAKPMAFFGEAESAEKSKKPEEPEQSRMEAVHDDLKGQASGDSQLLSIKHEISALDDTSDDTETETLASEEKRAVQETPVAIAPEAAPAVVSTTPKPDKPERINESFAANHSQENQPDLSKKTSVEVEDKSHDVLAATEITAVVAGTPAENLAPVQKISDSKVIKSIDREQKAQSQKPESLEITVNDKSDAPVAASSLNAKNNARLESSPIDLKPSADTRQHDRLDALDTAAATDTPTDTDKTTLSRATAEPEKSAGVTLVTDSHSMPQTEGKSLTTAGPSSSPRTNDYGNEAPTPSNPLQKDIEKELARLNNSLFVSPAEISDLDGAILAAEESASATEQGSNLEQQSVINDDLNTAEISIVAEPVKPTKHSENISPTEQSTNDVLNTTDRETISVEPDLENDIPLGKPTTRKVDFALFQDIDDIDNTQAATYPAVEAEYAIDKDNKTEESQKAAANWASEGEIFVVKQPPEMPHFADDEMGATASADDKLGDFSMPSQTIPSSVPTSEIAAVNQHPQQEISENLELKTNADLASDSPSSPELPLDPEVNMKSDSASVKPEMLAKSEVSELDMTPNPSINQSDYKSDEVKKPQQTTNLLNESETIYIDLRSGYAAGENPTAKTSIVADQTTISPGADLPDSLEIADGERDDVIADYNDLARQSAINGDLESAHKITFAHPLSGLWADDSRANPEEKTPARSGIGVTAWLAQLVGAVAVYVTCSRRARA